MPPNRWWRAALVSGVRRTYWERCLAASSGSACPQREGFHVDRHAVVLGDQRVLPRHPALHLVLSSYALWGGPVLLVLLVVQGWHFPANDMDSMTYHLARAAYWMQWQRIAHFNTNSIRQLAFPCNVEVLDTALRVLMHSTRAIYLVQMVA